MKEITDKQREFAYLYVAGEKSLVDISNQLNVHRNTLTLWLKNDDVKNFIGEIRQQNSVLSLSDKKAKLISIIHGEVKDIQQVVNPKTGQIETLYNSRVADRINALKLLAQLDGDLVDNKSVNIAFVNGDNSNVPKNILIENDGKTIELSEKDFKFIDAEVIEVEIDK